MALVATACGSDSGGGAGTTELSAETSTSGPASTTSSSAPTTTVVSGPVVVETAAPTLPPTTSAPEPEPIDWGNQVYAAACGSAEPIDLVDGIYEPLEYNRDGGHLRVSLVGAEPIPTRPDATLVHLTCLAGGPGASLSGELYVMFRVAGDGATEQQLVVVGEPGAQHVVNDDGVVVIDDTTYGANDPNCCPSVFRSRQIVWGDDGLPVAVEGSRPDTPATPLPTGQACVATELDAASADPSQALLLEQALAVAGFDPGPVDGVLDASAMNAVVRLIEFNADNPELHSGPNAPYTNLHAEARDHGVVRTPVLNVLGIGCPDVAELPAR
ncbi:MAG TPA: hypothetical protein VNQ73_08670 [Ilumatobacter sp.]|nr:hypothetical protein [Ilumatobacter sp.]